MAERAKRRVVEKHVVQSAAAPQSETAGSVARTSTLGSTSRVVGVHSRDPLGDARLREEQALDRSRRERQEGERGRVVDLEGRDVDLGTGGAFSTRRR